MDWYHISIAKSKGKESSVDVDCLDLYPPTQDDDLKAKAVENLIRTAPEKGLVLHVIPVTMNDGSMKNDWQHERFGVHY